MNDRAARAWNLLAGSTLLANAAAWGLWGGDGRWTGFAVGAGAVWGVGCLFAGLCGAPGPEPLPGYTVAVLLAPDLTPQAVVTPEGWEVEVKPVPDGGVGVAFWPAGARVKVVAE